MATHPHLTARRFLRTGNVARLSPTELIAVVEGLIRDETHVSYRRALKWAELYAERSRGQPDEMRLSALRALGRTAHFAGRHHQALRAFLSARPLARNDAVTIARIDRMLTDIYMYLGRMGKARESARRSIRIFAARDMLNDLAQSKVNLANVLHRQDRHREAERLYHKAADYFETTDNSVALARCYYNRANTLVQLFDLDAGETLYERAFALWQEAGCDLDACDARYGLAWLRLLRGRYDDALRQLTDCEQKYKGAGDPRGVALCQLDRAEVYLGLGMFRDALTAAAGADRAFTKLHLRYERAKAKLFHGLAAAALGFPTSSRSSLRNAKRLFHLERNDSFSTITSLLATGLNGGMSSRGNGSSWTEKQLSRNQLPYWEAVYYVRRSFDDEQPTSHLEKLRRNSAAKNVPYLFALWQVCEGDDAYSRGNPIKAREHWHIAADRIDAVRSQLPPIELRSNFGRHAILPHQRMLRYELRHDPAEAAVWAERIRTVGLWAPLPQAVSGDTNERERAQKALADLAQQVSQLSRGMDIRTGTRQLAATGNRRLRLLHQDLRHRLLDLERLSGSSWEGVADVSHTFRDLSKDLTILQWAYDDPDLVALVHQQGELRVIRFPAGVARLSTTMVEWRFFMERALLTTGENRQYLHSERRFWSEVGAWLWQPLDISSSSPRVLVLPEGELSNLPWGAMIVGGEALVDTHTFLTAPSIRHFAASRNPRIQGKSTRIFCSNAKDLPFAELEMREIAELLPQRPLIYSRARREDWPVDGSDRMWHFSGHAELRTDNPFYSYLMMSDGPIFAADFRLRRCRVDLVTLAACQSGEQVTVPGEEASGLVRALLEMGARNVVASSWPVADDATRRWMKVFYENIANATDISTACRTAALATRREYPSACHWAAFNVSGAGEFGGTNE